MSQHYVPVSAEYGVMPVATGLVLHPPGFVQDLSPNLLWSQIIVLPPRIQILRRNTEAVPGPNVMATAYAVPPPNIQVPPPVMTYPTYSSSDLDVHAPVFNLPNSSDETASDIPNEKSEESNKPVLNMYSDIDATQFDILTRVSINEISPELQIEQYYDVEQQNKPKATKREITSHVLLESCRNAEEKKKKVRINRDLEKEVWRVRSDVENKNEADSEDWSYYLSIVKKDSPCSLEKDSLYLSDLDRKPIFVAPFILKTFYEILA